MDVPKMQLSDNTPVIIGFSLKLPGIHDEEALWQFLLAGNKSHCIVDTARDWCHRDGIAYANLFPNYDFFKPEHFGLSAKQTATLDPQQLLALYGVKTCWHQAGLKISELQHARTGVYAGVMSVDSLHKLAQAGSEVDGSFFLNHCEASVANRVSHRFNFTGESKSINAACASSLIALQDACTSIQTGRNDFAFVVGVNHIDSNLRLNSFNKAGMLSASGWCNSFSIEADGYLPTEGVVVVLLTSKAKAEAIQASLWATVVGFCANHNGLTASLSYPDAKAQTELIQQAQQQCSVLDVGYIEAHGIGSSLGDPIELEALSRTYPGSYVGSMKANVGHMEAGSGLLGVIKAILILHHQHIPPQVLEGQAHVLMPDCMHMNLQALAYPHKQVAVSSFGFSGANAHVIVQKLEQKTPSLPKNNFKLPWLLSATQASVLEDKIEAAQQLLQSGFQPALNCLLNSIYAQDHPAQHRRLAWIDSDSMSLHWLEQEHTSISVPIACMQLGSTYLRSYFEQIPVNCSNLSAFWLRIVKDFYPAVTCIEATGSGLSLALQANQQLQTHLIIDGAFYPALTHLDAYVQSLIDGLQSPKDKVQAIIADSVALYNHQYTFKFQLQSLLSQSKLLGFDNSDLAQFDEFLEDNQFILSLLWARVSIANKWQLLQVKQTLLNQFPDSYQEIIGLLEHELLLFEEIDLLLRMDAVFLAAFKQRLIQNMCSVDKAKTLKMLWPYYLPTMEYKKKESAKVQPVPEQLRSSSSLSTANSNARSLAIGHNLDFQLPLVSELLNHCVFHFADCNPLIVAMDAHSEQDLVTILDNLLAGLWLEGREVPLDKYLGSIAFIRQGYFTSINDSVVENISDLEEFHDRLIESNDSAAHGFSNGFAVDMEFRSLNGQEAEITPGITLPSGIEGDEQVIDTSIQQLHENSRVTSIMMAAQPTEDALSQPVIVGYSARLPGCKDLEAFWQLLVNQKDVFRPTPETRLRYMSNHLGAYVDAVDEFDAEFFQIAPLEAQAMDPQLRLLLQEVWRAIDMAGINHNSLSTSSTGVYVGASSFDYAKLLARHGIDNPYIPIATSHSQLANRISQFFDLTGPSEAIDTACSSSLYALAKAYTAIQLGEIDQAIVCGVNILLDDACFKAYAQSGLLSASAACKPFDTKADGYLRGEGIIVLVLQKESLAKATNSTIYARVLASAINHSGKTNVLNPPSSKTQQQLYQQIYAKADIHRVSYLEAQGAATLAGDALELDSWKHFLADKQVNMKVGSVKANIGHLEAASGLAGVIKLLLMLQKQVIPGQANLQNMHSPAAWQDSRLSISQKTHPWPETVIDGELLPRCAAMSSFGMGGVNVHMLFEQAQVFVGYGDKDDMPIDEPVFPFKRSRYWYESYQSKLLFHEQLRLVDAKASYQPLSGKSMAFIYSASFASRIKKLLNQLADSNHIAEYPIDNWDASHFSEFLHKYPNCDRFVVYLDIEAFHFDVPLASQSVFNQTEQLVSLLQSFMQAGYRAKNMQLDVYTSSQDTLEHPQVAMISGLLAAVSQEFNHWKLQHLDTDRALDFQLLETGFNDLAKTIYCRNNHYYCKDLSPVSPVEEAAFLQRGGVYLVLGGMGCIGQKLVPYLIDTYQAQVIVVGRNSLDPVAAAFIQNLGNQVEFVQTDLTDAVQCALLRKYLSQKYSHIDAAFDLVVEQHDGSFSELDWAALKEVVQVKLVSAQFIKLLQQEITLKAAVIFSSMQSYISIPGQIAHAAASCALDAYSNYLASIPNFNVKRINWSVWQEGRATLLQPARALGIEPLSTQHAWDAMATGLNSGLAQFAVQHQMATLPLSKLATKTNELVSAAVATSPELSQLPTGLDGVNELVYRLVADLKEELLNTDHLLKYTILVDYLSQLPKSQLPDWPVDQLLQYYLEHDKDYASYYRLVHLCYGHYLAIVTGRQQPAEVIFSTKASAWLADMFCHSPGFKTCNQQMVGHVENYLRSKNGRVTILEIGSSVGVTLKALAPILTQYAAVDYYYTDPCDLFLEAGRTLQQELGFKLHCRQLGLHQLEEFKAAEFDIVLANNILHLASDIEHCLSAIKRIIKPKGLFLLHETLQEQAYLNYIFGLFNAWWQVTGPYRLEYSPLLNSSNWQSQLTQVGFNLTGNNLPDANATQGVFCCMVHANNKLPSHSFLFEGELVSE